VGSHAAVLLPDDTLLLFGGWDAPVAYNDAYLLDLTLFDYTRLELAGTPPSPRRLFFIFFFFLKKISIRGFFVFPLTWSLWSQLALRGAVAWPPAHLYTRWLQRRQGVCACGSDRVSLSVPVVSCG
jgi:hypothetical protein